MKNLFVSFAFICILTTVCGQNTITFDDQGYSNLDDFLGTYSVTSNGVLFDHSSNATGTPGFEYRTSGGSCGAAGGWMLMTGTSGTTFTFETNDGSEFDLHSFDFINDYNCPIALNFVFSITVTGYKDGSAVAGATFSGSMPDLINNIDLTGNSNFDAIDRVDVSATEMVGSGFDNFSWSPASAARGSTNLSAGDIAFTGYNTDSPDGFAFITLVDLDAGTEVYFTDKGWNSENSAWYGNTEDHLIWTAPAGGLTAGGIVSISETSADVFSVSTGSVNLATGNSSFSLSGGDNILAYNSGSGVEPASPTFLAGLLGDDNFAHTSGCDDSVSDWYDCVNCTTAGQSCATTGTGTSGIPDGLTNGLNAVALFPSPKTELDNNKYNGPTTDATQAVWLSRLNDHSHWTGNDAAAIDITPTAFDTDGAFTVLPATVCTDSDVPTVTFSPSTVCNGTTASLIISGNLNDAPAWHVYTGSCGGTPLGTTMTGTFSITDPISSATTYYVRGEGGCVAPGSCGTVTITPTALDDASFSYSASEYCVDDNDPTPTITGLTAGSFGSAPAGLSINTATGAIDLAASTPGTYTVTYSTGGECPNSSDVSISINALDDASFSYGASEYCVDDNDPTPTITGLTAGSFGSAPAGLSINTASGAIDLAASTPGTYTVTYSTGGECPNSSDVSISINALDDASFSYGASEYCVDDNDPTPTITGLTAGSFGSAPAGLSINTASGAIDLAASTPGTYTVTYSTGGECPNSSSHAIEIWAAPSLSGESTPVSCPGGNDGSIDLTVSGGEEPYAYAWDNSATTEDLPALLTGTYTVTVTDDNGCIASDLFTINQLDNLEPVVECQNINKFLDGTGTVSITPSEIDNGSTDNCAITSFELSKNTFDCTELGPQSVTLTGTDAAGLYSSCEAVVTIQDNNMPSPLCANPNIILGNGGIASVALSVFDGGSAAVCGAVMVSASKTDFDCSDLGDPQNVTLTVTSLSSGLSASCTSTVTVEDPMNYCCAPPEAICNDLTIDLCWNGRASIIPADIGASSLADCGLRVEALSRSEFTCDNLGENTIIYTLNDSNGDGGQCTSTVTVLPGETLPPPNINVDIGQSNSGNYYAYHPCNRQFTIESSARNSPSGTEDDLAFIHIELCGDFTIDARVDSLTGDSGYAGLMARESTEPGSRQVSLLSNTTSLLRWEQRQVAGGPKTTSLINPTFPEHLRLVRTGSLLKAYTGNTSLIYQLVNSAQIGTSECLLVGISAFTNDPFGKSRAVFSEVFYQGAEQEWSIEPSSLEESPLGKSHYQAVTSITTDQAVASSSPVTLTAGDFITLKPGFFAGQGATFTARIEDCIPLNPNAFWGGSSKQYGFGTNENLGLSQVPVEGKLKVFPNPFRNQTNIIFSLPEEQKVGIQLFDLTGKMVSEVLPLSPQPGGYHQWQVEGSSLNPGVYLLAVQIGAQVQQRRLVVVK